MGEYLSPADQGLRAAAQGELRDRLAEGPIAIDEWFARLTILYYDHHAIGDDFMTPPELFPQMGRSMAIFALKAFNAMGKPDEFTVFEAGCGNGTLMRGFLEEAALNLKFFQALTYHVIEQSSNLITRQSEALLAYPELEEKVFWNRADVCSIDFPRTYAGMYIAIENDDDLPSKAVYKRNGLPSELFIVLEDGKVTQRELPASAELVQFLLDHREWWDAVPDGLRIPLPVHMESVRLRERLMRAFDKLIIFTTDYGYELTKKAQCMPNWTFPLCKVFMRNGKKSFSDGNTYAAMYNYAGIANFTSEVDFSLLALPGIYCSLQTAIVNNRDFLAHHGLQRFVERCLMELVEQDRIPEAIVYVRRLASIVDIYEGWTTLVQWKGFDTDITVAEESDSLVSWLYGLANRYQLGDIQPEDRKGQMR